MNKTKRILIALGLTVLVQLAPVKANEKVTVINPDSSPAAVKLISGSGIVADPHVASAPGATPSPSPAKAVAVQGTGNASALPIPILFPSPAPSPIANLPVAINAALPAGTNAIGSVTVKQYTGTPSTFTVGTTDQTVFTLAAGEIGFIQNLDDAALAVKKGASASTSSFSFILAAGSAADDGKGGAVRIDDWVGAVSVAAMTGSPRYIAWKQAP